MDWDHDIGALACRIVLEANSNAVPRRPRDGRERASPVESKRPTPLRCEERATRGLAASGRAARTRRCAARRGAIPRSRASRRASRAQVRYDHLREARGIQKQVSPAICFANGTSYVASRANSKSQYTDLCPSRLNRCSWRCPVAPSGWRQLSDAATAADREGTLACAVSTEMLCENSMTVADLSLSSVEPNPEPAPAPAPTPAPVDYPFASVASAPSAPAAAPAPICAPYDDTPMSASSSPRATPLRKGKWTPEEEAFTSRIIHDFTNGYLPLAPGTTLRSYLSEKLNWWVKYSNFEFCATRI